MKYNCIVIEDELPAREKIKSFISEIKTINLLDTFNNAIDATSFLSENHVDLIFLDIELGMLSGIDFLKSLQHRPAVIITTAYTEYAIAGYEYNVVDYLLKPYSFERFFQAVTKFQQSFSNAQLPKENYLFIKTEYRIERVNLDDILYIEGMKDYLRIVCANEKLMTLLSFKKIMEKLPSDKFIRVHNSYIVSIEKIESIERDRIKIEEQLIPISKSNRKEFYTLVDNKVVK